MSPLPPRVYHNVDRDEDDEINTTELDFALKAVNYNLISDAEMNYVYSVGVPPPPTHTHTLHSTITELHFFSMATNAGVGAGRTIQAELQTVLSGSSTVRESGGLRVSQM